MVVSGTVTSEPVLAVKIWMAWPTPAMVQQPRVSFIIMPHEVMPLVQSAAAGGGGSAGVRYLPSCKVRLSVLMALRPNFIWEWSAISRSFLLCEKAALWGGG